MTLAVTDHATVARAQAGDVDVVADLYLRYRPQVRQLVFRRCGYNPHLADDLTADVFVKAIKYLPTYRDQGRDIGAWLATMAHRIVIDHFKKARLRLEVLEAETVDLPDLDVSVSPELSALSSAWSTEVWAAVAELRPSWREVLELRYRLDWSTDQVAAERGCTAMAVRMLELRALRALAADRRFARGAAR